MWIYAKYKSLSTMNYAGDGISFLNLRFENDVIWYGTQTLQGGENGGNQFENDVIWYGTQTILRRFNHLSKFENDIILNIKNSRQIHPTSCLYHI